MRHIFKKVPVLLLGIVFALPAEAVNISYQLSGTIGGNGGNLFDAGTFTPTTDNVSVMPDPFPSPVSFNLSFDLDDSIPGVPAGSNGSRFSPAISNLDLTINGMTFYSNSFDDAFQFVNGTNNHQWSIFSTGGLFNPGAQSLDVEDDMGMLVDNMQLESMHLFLLDLDSTLFSQNNHSDLVAFTGNEFEFSEINLNWFGDLYDYTVIGTIDNIFVSAVPLPATFWLFGTALFAFTGIAKRRESIG